MTLLQSEHNGRMEPHVSEEASREPRQLQAMLQHRLASSGHCSHRLARWTTVPTVPIA